MRNGWRHKAPWQFDLSGRRRNVLLIGPGLLRSFRRRYSVIGECFYRDPAAGGARVSDCKEREEENPGAAPISGEPLVDEVERRAVAGLAQPCYEHLSWRKDRIPVERRGAIGNWEDRSETACELEEIRAG